MNWRYLGKRLPAVAESSTPVDVASQCLFIGPVPDQNAAQQLSVSLAKQGVKAQPVPREGRVWVGHWVQIQGFADRELADAARQRLLKAGLPDAYVMQDGPISIISLGVFRERGRAERVIEAARRAGFKAVMRDRVRTARSIGWYPARRPANKWRLANSLPASTGFFAPSPDPAHLPPPDQ